MFIFMSGILGEEAGLLFKQIGKKLKNGNWDWHEHFKREATFFHVCFSEGRNYEQVAMVLCSFIPFPQTIAIDLSNEERLTELFIILNSCTSFSQLQLPVHLAIIRLNDEVYANLDDDLLAYFMASNTWLQTLCFSVRVIREKTTTLRAKYSKWCQLHIPLLSRQLVAFPQMKLLLSNCVVRFERIISPYLTREYLQIRH